MLKGPSDGRAGVVTTGEVYWNMQTMFKSVIHAIANVNAPLSITQPYKPTVGYLHVK